MANEAQRDYWNARPGQKWVAHHAALDRSMAEVTALLFRRTALKPGERVLDVGCGAGATVLDAARRVGRDGAVLGIDISAPLLALARERIAALPEGAVRLIEADAETHPFEAGAFDAVISRFGVMFFEHPKAAFANLRRALAPGGRLCFVCWAGLDGNPFFNIPLGVAARRLGPPEPTPPRAPGPLAFSDADWVAEILIESGFADLVIVPEATTLIGDATPEAEAAFLTRIGPAGGMIDARQPDSATVAAITAEIAEALRPYAADGAVRLPAALYSVCATAG